METDIKIAIADDHSIFRKGFISTLETLDFSNIVFEAINAKEVFDNLETKTPDILFLDIQMPDTTDTETLEKIKELYPDIKVIMISADYQDKTIIRFMKKGSSAFLSKDSTLEVLGKTIETVYDTGFFYDDKIMSMLSESAERVSFSINPNGGVTSKSDINNFPRYKGSYGNDTIELERGLVNIFSIQEDSVKHNNNIGLHSHANLFQLIVVEKGGGDIVLEEKQYQIRNHTLIAIPKNTLHSFTLHINAEGYVFNYSDVALENLFKKDSKLLSLLDCGLVLNIREYQELNEIIEKCVSEYNKKSNERGFALKSLSEFLFLTLHRVYTEKGYLTDTNKEKFYLRQFTLLIREFNSPHVKLDKYCNRLNLTERRLSYMCKQLCNKTPKQMILEYYIELAKNALHNSDQTIGEIADSLNFSSINHFTTVFKQHTGLSPSEYKVNKDWRGIHNRQ
ncbi:MAG: response regulator [Bacteroidetes bacterium]|nr:response regulator [Bacteroidota bacterium]